MPQFRFETMPEQRSAKFHMKLSLQHEKVTTKMTYSLSSITPQNAPQNYSFTWKLPVRVEINDDGTEYIFYDEKRMIENKPYQIKFHGEDIFIIKSANKIKMVDHIRT